MISAFGQGMVSGFFFLKKNSIKMTSTVVFSLEKFQAWKTSLVYYIAAWNVHAVFDTNINAITNTSCIQWIEME